MAKAALTPKQRFLINAAMVLAVLYSVGCALMVAAALMPIFVIPGGQLLALAFGFAFTYRYNWKLSSFSLPRIMLRLFNSKRGFFASIGYGIWSIALGLVGIALSPLTLVFSLVVLLFEGRSRAKEFYNNVMRKFGLMPPKSIVDRWLPLLNKEYDSHVLGWAMLILVGLGVGVMVSGVGPFVLGAVIIVAGIGCFVYKLTRGLAEYTNEKNQKKVMSRSLRVVLTMVTSIIILMGLAVGSLVIPVIPGLKQVFSVFGLSGMAVGMAFAAVVGTVLATATLMLVSVATYLKNEHIMESIRGFFVHTLWHGGMFKRSHWTPSAVGGVFVRVATFIGVIILGFWGVCATAYKSTIDLIKMTPLFAGSELLITGIIVVGMLGLFAEVLVAFWRRINGIIFHPKKEFSEFKTFLSNLVQWTFSWDARKVDTPWYGHNSVITAACVLFALPVFVVRAVVQGILIPTIKYLCYDCPRASLAGFIRLFPATYCAIAGKPRDFVQPSCGGDIASKEDTDATVTQQSNKRFSLFTKIRRALRGFDTNFTRFNNAIGNALIPYASTKAMLGNQTLTIFTVLAAWINSFSALFVTMSGNEREENVRAGADRCLELGEGLSSANISTRLGESTVSQGQRDCSLSMIDATSYVSPDCVQLRNSLGRFSHPCLSNTLFAEMDKRNRGLVNEGGGSIPHKDYHDSDAKIAIAELVDSLPNFDENTGLTLLKETIGLAPELAEEIRQRVMGLSAPKCV